MGVKTGVSHSGNNTDQAFAKSVNKNTYTGNNKKLEKVKENEMNRQVVCRENTYTNIYIFYGSKSLPK